MKYSVLFFKTHTHAQVPKYETLGAAGMDLCTVERFVIKPGERKVIDTGLRIKIPEGFEGQVRPRSGLAATWGITVVNSPGTIDSDYTGPLKVILLNTGDTEVLFACPDRIAQLVIAPVLQADVKLVDSAEELGNTKRGQGGLGSTGQ
jgi:dUTP pyrophosphatase